MKTLFRLLAVVGVLVPAVLALSHLLEEKRTSSYVTMFMDGDEQPL